MNSVIDSFVNRDADDLENSAVFVTGIDSFLRLYVLSKLLNFGRLRYSPLPLAAARQRLAGKEFDDYRFSYDEATRRKNAGESWDEISKIVAPITPCRYYLRLSLDETVALINLAGENVLASEPTNLLAEAAGAARRRLGSWYDYSTGTIKPK